MKYIFLLIIAYFVYRYFQATQKKSRATPTTPHKAIAMLPCEQCGLRIPENEAIIKNGKSFCCQAHAEQSNP